MSWSRTWKPQLQSSGVGPGMSVELKILNRKLRWHDGVGVSCEADQRHAEAIVPETGVSSLTPSKVHMSKESKGTARDNTEDVLNKRKWGKSWV